MRKAIAASGLFGLIAAGLLIEGVIPVRAATGTLGAGTLVPIAPGDRTPFAPSGTLLTKPAVETGSDHEKAKTTNPDQGSSGTTPGAETGAAPAKAGNE